MLHIIQDNMRLMSPSEAQASSEHYDFLIEAFKFLEAFYCNMILYCIMKSKITVE